MVDAPTLSERVLEAQNSLSRGERRLADLLLAEPTALVDLTATEMAARAGVSKATAARFFRRLGFASFRVAQREARMPRPGTPNGHEAGTTVGVDGAAASVRPDLGRHLANDVQNLVRSIEQVRSDELQQGILHLARADKLWVVGFGDNYALAHFARALLIRVKPDIRMIPIGGFSIPEEFASIRASDAMLALGVGRRTRSLRSIMRSAVMAGAQVVLVTDQAGRAGADTATVTLRCRTRGSFVFDSVVAPVSLLTFLCSALAARIGQGAIERLQSIERIHDEWGDLLPGEL